MGLPTLPGVDAEAVHIHHQERTVGPMSRRVLIARVSAGEIPHSATFWFSGMADWAELGQHPALLDLPAAETPPPYTYKGADGKAESAEDDAALDRVFGQLVKDSWKYHADHSFAAHIDEVFLGGIITGFLDGGWSLIDLSSDGSHHYLRFEEMAEHTRAIVRLTHLTPGLTNAKVLGQKAHVIVGYGEKTKNFTAVWNALSAEYKSGLLQGDAPGTISVDGDMSSQYVYCQVPLYLTIDDYVGRDYAIDYAKLARHLDASLNALRKYLRGRFA